MRWLYLVFSVLYRTSLANDLVCHQQQRQQQRMLGFVVVICRGPCADERKTAAGVVDHGFL